MARMGVSGPWSALLPVGVVLSGGPQTRGRARAAVWGIRHGGLLSIFHRSLCGDGVGHESRRAKDCQCTWRGQLPVILRPPLALPKGQPTTAWRVALISEVGGLSFRFQLVCRTGSKGPLKSISVRRDEPCSRASGPGGLSQISSPLVELVQRSRRMAHVVLASTAAMRAMQPQQMSADLVGALLREEHGR